MPACAVEVERSALTDRELEVLRLIGAGRTTRQISEGLGISQRTVENHKRRIFAKLDVQSQAHAVASAARLGLLTLPTEAVVDGPSMPAPSGSVTGDHKAARPVGVRLVLGRPGPLRERLARTLQHGLARDADGPASNGAAVNGRVVGGPTTNGPATDSPVMDGQVVNSPVVVLVDPGPEDWRAAECLGARVVLVCSGELDEAGVVEAFLRGADALVPASRVPQELATVVELVGLGSTVVHPAHARVLVEMARLQLVPRTRPALALTPREREILDSIDRGESVKQTANALGISAKTVENLQGRLFRKLGVRNRAQAVAAAHAHGLLASPRIIELQPSGQGHPSARATG